MNHPRITHLHVYNAIGIVIMLLVIALHLGLWWTSMVDGTHVDESIFALVLALVLGAATCLLLWR